MKPYNTKAREDEEAVCITGPDGRIIADAGIARLCKSAEEANAVTQANIDMARRIAACLNACDGIATDKLETFTVAQMVAAAVLQRDALLAALEAMVGMMDSGDEPGAGSPWYQQAVAAIAAVKGPAQ